MGRLILFAIVFAILAVFIASFLSRIDDSDDGDGNDDTKGGDNVRHLSDKRSNKDD